MHDDGPSRTWESMHPLRSATARRRQTLGLDCPSLALTGYDDGVASVARSRNYCVRIFAGRIRSSCPPEREKLAADLKARLERFHDVDMKDYDYDRPEEKPRHVFSFSIKDPDPYYYHGASTTFRLLLDDDWPADHQGCPTRGESRWSATSMKSSDLSDIARAHGSQKSAQGQARQGA